MNKWKDILPLLLIGIFLFSHQASARFNRPDPVGLVDPATGKINQQMLLNPQLQNRYVYALNNPYRYADPDGNFPVAIALFAAGAWALDAIMPQSTNVPNSNGALDYMDTATIATPIGAIGLGIKARKIVGPLYKTTREATKAAKKLGYTKTKNTIHGEAVYKKGKSFITRDATAHNGGVWKKGNSVKSLGKRETRQGTYDKNLKKIGD